MKKEVAKDIEPLVEGSSTAKNRQRSNPYDTFKEVLTIKQMKSEESPIKTARQMPLQDKHIRSMENLTNFNPAISLTVTKQDAHLKVGNK